MMARAVSFPHPVLGNNDDIIDGRFTFEPEVEPDGETYKIGGRFSLDNVELERLITAGVAEFVLRIECSGTYLSEWWFADSDKCLCVSVPEDHLRGTVALEPLVVASDGIPQYQPSGAHSDYGEISFSVNPGQMLAIGPKHIFMAEKGFDPLRIPTHSIIMVQKGDFEDGPFQISYELDLLYVWLSQHDWEQYGRIKFAVPYANHSMIVVPVLAEAIRKVFDESEREQYEELVWFQKLSHWIQVKDLPTDDPLTAAQELLEFPLKRALKQLESEVFEGQDGDQ